MTNGVKRMLVGGQCFSAVSSSVLLRTPLILTSPLSMGE
jgi:hypothetical protein